MKKKVFLLLALFGIFIFLQSFHIAHAAEVPTIVDSSTLDKIQQGQQGLDDLRWDYLSQKWKEALLKNKFVAAMDAFFKKIDFLFVLITGQHYELSFTLFSTLLLWLFFFMFFGSTLANFSTFDRKISYVIGFALSVIAAQTGIYRSISDFLFKIIFYKEGVWPWISFFICIFFFIFLFTLYNGIIKNIASSIKAKAKKKAEKLQKKNMDIVTELATDMVDAGDS